LVDSHVPLHVMRLMTVSDRRYGDIQIKQFVYGETLHECKNWKPTGKIKS